MIRKYKNIKKNFNYDNLQKILSVDDLTKSSILVLKDDSTLETELKIVHNKLYILNKLIIKHYRYMYMNIKNINKLKSKFSKTLNMVNNNINNLRLFIGKLKISNNNKKNILHSLFIIKSTTNIITIKFLLI